MADDQSQQHEIDLSEATRISGLSNNKVRVNIGDDTHRYTDDITCVCFMKQLEWEINNGIEAG
jgi:hypothetical protein